MFTCCSPSKSKTSDAMLRLHDIWALETLDSKDIPSKLLKRPTIEIFVKDKKVIGNDGCNSMSGAITKITENELVFDQLRGTKMACPNMDFSQKFST